MDLMQLPADGRAAGQARAVVRDRLRGWDLEELLDTAVLLTSEVVANVIIHTASAPSFAVARDGSGVRVDVVDGSPAPPHRRMHSATATTGRGIELLEDLADDWGWTPVSGGKVVWFRVGSAGADPSGEPTPVSAMGPAPAPASPLGRYAAGGESTAATVRVELLDLPVRLLAATREHHDDLMREFRLLALAGQPAGTDVPARLLDLTQTLGVRYATARSRPDAEVDRALEQGLDTIDLAYEVPPAVVDSARRLEAMMSEADGLCRSAKLITLARTPVMVRFATWYLAQFTDQIAGLPATGWDGPLDPG